MSGTKAGGSKTAETNRRKYGEDFYAKIGQKGGSKTAAEGAKPKGFAANLKLASTAGAKGGRTSRRGPIKQTNGGNYGETYQT